MTLAARALTAVRAGATTSPALALALSTSKGTAKVVMHNLAATGALRWTGRLAATSDKGRPSRIYEATEKATT